MATPRAELNSSANSALHALREWNPVIDRALYRRALAVADQPVDRKNFINAVLRTFIARQAQACLCEMGGIAPNLPDIPRWRQDREDSSNL